MTIARLAVGVTGSAGSAVHGCDAPESIHSGVGSDIVTCMARGTSPRVPAPHRPDAAGAPAAADIRASLPTFTLPGRAARLGDTDHDAAIDSVTALSPHRVGLISLVGSRAYHLHTPDSDADYRGFYVAPARDFLGLDAPVAQIESSGTVDICVYELGKFCHLALAGNPNVLEVLWADTLRADDAGAAVIGAREAFLSARVRDTYLGYAKGQMKRALRSSTPDRRRREKAIRHIFRLGEQGERLLREGTLTVAVADAERIHALGRLDNHHLEREFAALSARLQNMPTDLPPHPDRARIDTLVRDLRLATLAP